MSAMPQPLRSFIVWLFLLGTAVVVLTPKAKAGRTVESAQVPACFITDTVYHAVISLSLGECRLWYGDWSLAACLIEFPQERSELQAFAEQWRSPGKAPWQSVKRRGVWSGRPAVSDTVIEVVSEVAKADPELIKRVYPDRFQVDLTGGFRLLVTTPAGAEQKKSLAETWNDFSSRIRAFGRLQTLEIVVSPDDAQTLYYALEPGTPIVLH
jgi:hypothetical protein